MAIVIVGYTINYQQIKQSIGLRFMMIVLVM